MILLKVIAHDLWLQRYGKHSVDDDRSCSLFAHLTFLFPNYLPLVQKI